MKINKESKQVVIVVDIGGTKTGLGLFCKDIGLLVDTGIVTMPEKGCEALIKRVYEHALVLLEQCNIPYEQVIVWGDGLGWWEIKGGDITVVRFDAHNGNYSLFADEGIGVDGPPTDGNYLWLETSDWLKWEKKLIYGPYIHHIICAHGKYKDVLFLWV